MAGAWNYAAQYTTDLSGATGWTDVPETTGKTKLAIGGLTSGIRYAFRLRPLNGGAVGPWSATIVQMAPEKVERLKSASRRAPRGARRFYFSPSVQYGGLRYGGQLHKLLFLLRRFQRQLFMCRRNT